MFKRRKTESIEATLPRVSPPASADASSAQPPVAAGPPGAADEPDPADREWQSRTPWRCRTPEGIAFLLQPEATLTQSILYSVVAAKASIHNVINELDVMGARLAEGSGVAMDGSYLVRVPSSDAARILAALHPEPVIPCLGILAARQAQVSACQAMWRAVMAQMSPSFAALSDFKRSSYAEKAIIRWKLHLEFQDGDAPAFTAVTTSDESIVVFRDGLADSAQFMQHLKALKRICDEEGAYIEYPVDGAIDDQHAAQVGTVAADKPPTRPVPCGDFAKTVRDIFDTAANRVEVMSQPSDDPVGVTLLYITRALASNEPGTVWVSDGMCRLLVSIFPSSSKVWATIQQTTNGDDTTTA